MAFNNPPMPWSELERIASGRGVPPALPVGDEEAPRSHKREGYQPPQGLRPRADVEARGARVP
ncbi:hypothetical protein QRX50_35460 [Amycolatopsis carbonis]|uniref:Uncharacterized protein n=1 Tax=Amycolatopsis carbonis TaxID=715471 RepID=A0A9Y2IBJ9_9PSEU|nr:hypothetical protein [Amycolatopsis sp. 2-15]WIX76712.1 hypothetical protein QRX50_35460 [Amycolatopsis sp. 2-15]